MVIDGGTSITDIRAKIIGGYAAGMWNGPGIVSSVARVAPRFALAYSTAGQVGISNFLGEPVDTTDVLVRYTYGGDADLSLSVNLDDFTRLAAAFGTSSVWSSGDFNYDGVTNLDDFTILASNFGLTVTTTDLPRGLAVPEPSVIGVLSASLLAILRRRNG
jgi:hypothetical protein